MKNRYFEVKKNNFYVGVISVPENLFNEDGTMTDEGLNYCKDIYGLKIIGDDITLYHIDGAEGVQNKIHAIEKTIEQLKVEKKNLQTVLDNMEDENQLKINF